MFNVIYAPYGGRRIVATVYAVDRSTEEFLIANPSDDFEWIPMDRCLLYDPDKEDF